MRKLKEEKKVKFTICVKPEIYNRMEKDMIKKSRLIEKLLEEYYYDKKVCSKCKEDKDFCEFQKNSHSKDGYRSECSLCSKKTKN